MAYVLTRREVRNMAALGEPVPMFVYGTLRPGMALSHYLAGVTVKQEPAVARGYHLLRYPMYGYPHMVKRKGGVVRGDLLWVEPSPNLDWVVGMETRAGYDATMIEVEVPGVAITHSALSFVYHVSEAEQSKMMNVPDNDWSSVSHMAVR